MALARLTDYEFNTKLLRLDYSDGRQWYVPYLAIIATLIDPTSGQYVGKIFEKGLVGETLEATQKDLNALNIDVFDFISKVNNSVGNANFWLGIYQDYNDRADLDGADAQEASSYICAFDRAIAILPTATEGYILTWNTQTRSLADGGNGFNSRTLDCAADRIDSILN